MVAASSLTMDFAALEVERLEDHRVMAEREGKTVAQPMGVQAAEVLAVVEAEPLARLEQMRPHQAIMVARGATMRRGREQLAQPVQAEYLLPLEV